MFGWLKRAPIARLKNEYAKKLEQALDMQRCGDVVGSSRVMAEAEAILKQIETAECGCTTSS